MRVLKLRKKKNFYNKIMKLREIFEKSRNKLLISIILVRGKKKEKRVYVGLLILMF